MSRVEVQSKSVSEGQADQKRVDDNVMYALSNGMDHSPNDESYVGKSPNPKTNSYSNQLSSIAFVQGELK
jgi:hypothetical protein